MIEEWINEKFITPLCHYYTLEATIVYGIILVLAALGTYKLLQKLKIKIDKYFFYALLPYIIYGGWTRALRDHNLGIYGDAWYFCSPPIYFVIFAITISTLLIGLLLQKKFKIDYWKFMMTIGILMLLYNLSLTTITNFYGFGMILIVVIIWAALFFGLSYFKPKLLSKINAAIISSHLLDASSTFIALTFFGYYEQHVLPSFLINIFGPWIMFPLKIIVVWFVLYYIDKKSKDKFFNNFLKIIILILGLSLGVRGFLTIAMLSV